MRLHLCIGLGLGLMASGCAQSTTGGTQTATTNRTPYKLTGNRSADPLGNPSLDNSGTGMTPDPYGLAQRAGTPSMDAHR